MNCRIVHISLAEVAVDPDAVAATLEDACHREKGGFMVSGVCQTRNSAIFPLEQAPDERVRLYTIRALDGTSDQDVIAAIHAHWQGSVVTRGVIRADDGNTFWGVFEHFAEDAV